MPEYGSKPYVCQLSQKKHFPNGRGQFFLVGFPYGDDNDLDHDEDDDHDRDDDDNHNDRKCTFDRLGSKMPPVSDFTSVGVNSTRGETLRPFWSNNIAFSFALGTLLKTPSHPYSHLSNALQFSYIFRNLYLARASSMTNTKVRYERNTAGNSAIFS